MGRLREFPQCQCLPHSSQTFTVRHNEDSAASYGENLESSKSGEKIYEEDKNCQDNIFEPIALRLEDSFASSLNQPLSNL